MDREAVCLPVLIKRICDKFGIKRDVRQAVAVLHPTDHPRPAVATHKTCIVCVNIHSYMSKEYFYRRTLKYHR